MFSRTGSESYSFRARYRKYKNRPTDHYDMPPSRHANIQYIMEIISNGPACTPTLLHIVSLASTIPRTRYAVYYEIPLFPRQYRPLETMSHLLVTHSRLRFQILDLEMVDQSPLVQEAALEAGGDGVLGLHLRHAEGEIIVRARIVSKGAEEGMVYSLSVADISGYLNFMKFREKYRILENITRKREFKLDHRLKVTDGPTTYYFNLEQSDSSCYFFTSTQLRLQIEEVYSVEDWNMVETIFEENLVISSGKQNYTATINILNKLKLALSIDAIKNRNYSTSGLACLRLCQVSVPCGQVTVGTDCVGELAKVQPVLEQKFYDYQFGYLSANIKAMQSTEIYDNLDKLTKAFPKYPHLKNAKLIDINGAKFVIFRLKIKGKQQVLKIPMVYVLEGFNIVETDKCSIKFIIQFSGVQVQNVVEKPADRRRVYDLRFSSIWNLGQVASRYRNFTVKIISFGTTYTIPFSSQEVEPAQFRKEAKNLQLRQQYSELQGNKLKLLTALPGSQGLLMTKTDSINDFYLLDLFSSSSITFQVVSGKQIVLQGSILRDQITQCMGNLQIVMSSADSLMKAVLHFSINQITQSNASMRTYYKFLYKLQYADSILSENVSYDFQLRRLTDNKKYKTRVHPQISDDGVSTLHPMEDGFFEPTHEDIEIGLVLRKMYYNEQTELFDNGDVLNKCIVVNSEAKQQLDKTMIISIREEGYTSLSFDFYDENIKKRLKFYLQICMCKMPLLDLRNGLYTIKVPQYLWRANKFEDGFQSITLESNLSRRKNSSQKITLFPDSPAEYQLKQHNYKDSLCLIVNEKIGYEKVIDAIKIRCDATDKAIGWLDDSEWYLGLINVEDMAFYFLIKFGFDPEQQDQKDSEGSVVSRKTAGKKGSERSYSQKIDGMAKTVKNVQVTQLKQTKNSLIEQSRNLTAQHVRKQEMILKLKKQIAETDEKILKAKNNQSAVTENTGSSMVKKNPQNLEKARQLYRSICGCGAKNPKFNGFCQECLVELRKRYEVFLKQYKQKSEEYERIYFNKFNSKQKYLRVKNKLKQYKARLKEGRDIEEPAFEDMVIHMEENEIKRKIQQCKIELFQLDEERLRLETHSKDRLNSVEQLIRREDEQIWDHRKQLEALTQQLNSLHQRIS